jgi:hypothetical protein
MKAILALAAAVASLACASSALRSEFAQRPQNRALQAPAHAKAKASREQDIVLPRPKPNDVRAKVRRTKDTRTRNKKDTRDTKDKKDRSAKEKGATKASAKRSGEPKTTPATPRKSGAAPATPSELAPGAGSRPSTAVEEAPQPPITWSTDEVLAASARCVELLAPIIAEVTVDPAIRIGPCGTPSPVVAKRIGGVEMRPPITVNCNMVPALHIWLEDAVQPAARDFLGEEIAAVSGAVGYQCRNRSDTGRTSEHGFANAIDILGFTTRSGRRVSVLNDWGAMERECLNNKPTGSGKGVQKQCKADESLPAAIQAPAFQGRVRLSSRMSELAVPVLPAKRSEPSPELRFLKRIHQQACSQFTTVLGPDANQAHRNHFHLDLTPRNSGSSYCR